MEGKKAGTKTGVIHKQKLKKKCTEGKKDKGQENRQRLEVKCKTWHMRMNFQKTKNPNLHTFLNTV